MRGSETARNLHTKEARGTAGARERERGAGGGGEALGGSRGTDYKGSSRGIGADVGGRPARIICQAASGSLGVTGPKMRRDGKAAPGFPPGVARPGGGGEGRGQVRPRAPAAEL